jgi:hypothetical protein
LPQRIANGIATLGWNLKRVMANACLTYKAMAVASILSQNSSKFILTDRRAWQKQDCPLKAVLKRLI